MAALPGQLAAWSAVSAQEAARLGADLTPMGAEKAGNADGTIPEWTGGIKSAAEAGFPNFKSGEHHPDPFASDKPLFTITPANMGQYAAKLTEGHKKLLQTYPDYKLIVYPTHRSAAYPQRIYDATKRIATTANLAPGGNGVTGAAEGIPFPIPKQGVEVFWNHVLRFRAETIQHTYGQAPVTAGGSYTMVKLKEDALIQYVVARDDRGGVSTTSSRISSRRRLSPRAWPARFSWSRRRSISPRTTARRGSTTRASGECAARPNVAFDNPGTNCGQPAHLRPVRHVQRQSGTVRLEADRQEGDLCPLQLLRAAERLAQVPRHPEEESHQPGPAPATSCIACGSSTRSLKPGTSHIYSRRTLYVDEDSWQILVVDCYDSRGQLYRVQEGHAMNYYELPNLWTALELVMDLSNGRYLAMGLQNEEPKYATTFRPGALPPTISPVCCR